MFGLYTLKEYFIKKEYAFYYYDVLMKKADIKKKCLLEELGINYMTYIRNREKSTANSYKIIAILEKYFNINPLDYNKLEKYDKVFNDAITKACFKFDNLEDVKQKIKECLADDNYLKPIFELLLAIVELSDSDFLMDLREDYKREYLNLKAYELMYDISPIKELYAYLLINTGDKAILLKYKNVEWDSMYKGYIYNALAMNAFYNKKYDMSYYYSTNAYIYLIKECNYKRILISNFTYFICLAHMRMYNKLYEKSRSQAIYLYQSKADSKLFSVTKLHFYNSLLGLDKYDELLCIIKSYANLDDYDIIYKVIALYYSDKKKFDSYTDEIYNYLKENNASNMLLFRDLIDYLNNDDKANSNFFIKYNINKGLQFVFEDKNKAN